MKLRLLSLTLAILCACGSNGGGQAGLPGSGEPPDASVASVVTLERRDGRYTLVRNGATYRPQGAGLGSGDPAVLAEHGGNSYRTDAPGADIEDAKRQRIDARSRASSPSWPARWNECDIRSL
jgi:hypothetical protein